MLEPPSAKLSSLLRELQLCTPEDLRRCQGRVRRLAYDLPAFDSVWLDALVQARRLTPYQAQILESAEAYRLRVGPHVLVNRLGGGTHSSTYLGRAIGNRELRVLKLVDCHEELLPEATRRFDKLLKAAAGFSHPSIVIPARCEVIDRKLVLASRYVPGRHLMELMIRRGRFPFAVVWDIARQLLEGLAALGERGIVHGDIRCVNVQLTFAGTAVLVDAGVEPALTPELMPYAHVSPERYDGIAPELIETGRTVTSASDLYALGCLLWHLLAGRPPFPGGDPLGKLAAHRLRIVPDVREYAPDTPVELASLIRSLTARNPQQRPKSAAAILNSQSFSRPANRRRLAAFYRSFSSQAPRLAGSGPRSLITRGVLFAALLFAVSGVAVGMSQRGATTRLLSLWKSVVTPIAPVTATRPQPTGPESPTLVETTSKAEPASSCPGCLSLPMPDERGVITLDAPGPYEAAKIDAVGDLTIRGKQNALTEIRVAGQPLSITAVQVRLENVVVKAAPAVELAGQSPKINVLAQIKAQNVDLRNCQFIAVETDQSLVTSGKAGISAIAWKMWDEKDRSAGSLQAENVICATNGPALLLAGTARELAWTNCLKLGAGAFLQVLPSAPYRIPLEMRLKSVTARGSSSLVSWVVPPNSEAATAAHSVTITAEDSALDLQGERCALFAFHGATLPSGWQKAFEFHAENTLANPEVQVAGWMKTSERIWEPLDDTQIVVDGLVTGAFEFFGPLGLSPQTSAIKSFDGPRRDNLAPGIIPANFASRDR